MFTFLSLTFSFHYTKICWNKGFCFIKVIRVWARVHGYQCIYHGLLVESKRVPFTYFICTGCCLVTSRVWLFCDSVDCSPPCSSPWISQARILEWLAISFSRGSSQIRDRIHVSYIGRQIAYHWATGEALILFVLLVIKSEMIQQDKRRMC